MTAKEYWEYVDKFEALKQELGLPVVVGDSRKGDHDYTFYTTYYEIRDKDGKVLESFDDSKSGNQERAYNRILNSRGVETPAYAYEYEALLNRIAYDINHTLDRMDLPRISARDLDINSDKLDLEEYSNFLWYGSPGHDNNWPDQVRELAAEYLKDHNISLPESKMTFGEKLEAHGLVSDISKDSYQSYFESLPGIPEDFDFDHCTVKTIPMSTLYIDKPSSEERELIPGSWEAFEADYPSGTVVGPLSSAIHEVVEYILDEYQDCPSLIGESLIYPIERFIYSDPAGQLDDFFEYDGKLILGAFFAESVMVSQYPPYDQCCTPVLIQLEDGNGQEINAVAGLFSDEHGQWIEVVTTDDYINHMIPCDYIQQLCQPEKKITLIHSLGHYFFQLISTAKSNRHTETA